MYLYIYEVRCKIMEELVQCSWNLVAVTSLPLYRYIVIFLFDQGKTCTVFVETGRCDVTGVLLSNQASYIMELDIFFAVSLHIWWPAVPTALKGHAVRAETHLAR